MIIDGIHCDKYSVTKEGLVKGPRGFLKGQVDRGGYLRVQLWIEGTRHYRSVHRLVAENFIDNPEGKTEVNHIDGDKSNNRVENLEWVTRCENMSHAVSTGLRRVGEKSPVAKISDADVDYIRRNIVRGCPSFGVKALARKFSISTRYLNMILKGDYRVKHID